MTSLAPASRRTFTVVIPMTHPTDARRCVHALQRQRADFEIVIVSEADPDLDGVRWMRERRTNPALRRNLAVAATDSDYIAFIDDDAYPTDEYWLANAHAALEADAALVALGGPDLLRPDAPFRERISDVLLAHPLMGSGVRAHQVGRRAEAVRDPSALSLCNLIVRRSAFEAVGGLDEGIGYGGEDTELLCRLREHGSLRFDPAVRVFHRKRLYGLPYLRQRFHFRMRNGRALIESPSLYLSNPKMLAFLAAGLLWLGLLGSWPVAALLMLAAHMVLAALCTLPYLSRDLRFAVLPVAFLSQHVAYYAGVAVGIAQGITRAFRARRMDETVSVPRPARRGESR